VWGGAAVRLEVEGEGADGRFAEVRRMAREALDGTREEWAEVPPERRPRFFGGFGFLDRSGGDPVWRGFPSASFVLPGVVVRGEPGRTRLLVQGSKMEGEGLEGRLRRLEGMLRTAARGDGQFEGSPSGGAVARAEPPEGARGAWIHAVNGVLDRIREGRVRKVVLSRTLDARFPWDVDPHVALRFLREENPRAHVFLLELRPGRILLGAAPEILADLRAGRFQATAVAGSVPRGRDRKEDEALAAQLRSSPKDCREHRFTLEEMVEVLEGRLDRMEVEEVPSVLQLARIQHLETAMRGLARETDDVLALVEALHPTPAVCGRPRDDALALIRAAEPFDRGWYAGPVGWFDPAGDGDFVPALRSAVGAGREWRLFAGAGIVAGSDASAEWEETALKFEPALRALGAGAGEP
jgi:menaquinone-specific isochorismate synthase